MEIRERVKAVAKANGMTLNEIAKTLEITRMSLWSRLNDPKLSTLEEIAGIIGVSVSAFFVEDGRPGADLSCPHCGAPIKIFIG